MANLKKAEVKTRLLAAAAVHRDVDAATKALSVSSDHLVALQAEDPEWYDRLVAVAAFDPAVVEPFIDFRLRCFGHSTPPHHARIIKALEAARPGSISVILAYPQAGKTTLLTDWYCWKLAFDPNFRIAVISEGQDLARKIIGHVATRMTDEMVAPEYLRSFGPFQSPDRSKPWNADFLQVLRSSHNEKEPSLEARGANSRLYGGRYDKLVLDDIQSDNTAGDTKKLLRYIRQTVLTRPDDKKGSTSLVGSRVDSADIYRAMMDEEMVDHLVQIPALTQPVSADEHFRRYKVNGQPVIEVNPDCPARPVWERTSLHELAVRRWQVKEEIWARTYMQAQVAGGGAVFAEDEVEACKDLKRGLGRNSLGMECIITMDPAFDTGVCAFMVLALDAGTMWIIDALERHDIHRYEDMYEQVGILAARYRPSTCIIERNNMQRGLITDDRMQSLGEKFRFEVIGHQSHRQKNDPVLGVNAMASSFIDREISIPWGDDDARSAMRPLCDELVAWRPRSKIKQDSTMALWFGWIYWNDVRRTYSAPNVVRLHVPSWVARSRSA